MPPVKRNGKPPHVQRPPPPPPLEDTVSEVWPVHGLCLTNHQHVERPTPSLEDTCLVRTPCPTIPPPPVGGQRSPPVVGRGVSNCSFERQFPFGGDAKRTARCLPIPGVTFLGCTGQRHKLPRKAPKWASLGQPSVPNCGGPFRPQASRVGQIWSPRVPAKASSLDGDAFLQNFRRSLQVATLTQDLARYITDNESLPERKGGEVPGF